ncbi:PREDICTED: NADP-dependent malic enzyme-like [Priapulus caudatus]|uniref:Malic enzyme n=1 Tax=Priapulus caudatus TaxID=37621 RepID=A0ABM1ELZ8_PRICU|nr:PREDICTED: NADP-dependent malic enzyme-like [Priapulus caudatus]
MQTALMCMSYAKLLRTLPTAEYAASSRLITDHIRGKVKSPHADVKIRGMEVLRNNRLNKGMAFTLKERQMLGIHGLLPPVFFTQDQQAKRVMAEFGRWGSDLDRYIYISSLQDRNEKLFYKVLCENIEECMPIVYTPTVGQACQNWGKIFRKPKGLYITIHDAGHVYDILGNWPDQEVKAIVITDGERILGLGDLGAYGMGIPVGKLALYTALGGVKPEYCLPICVDVGTNNRTLLDDKYYFGLRHKRVTGPVYDDLIQEIMEAIVKRFGQDTLVQFEDFGNHNAFRFKEKYKHQYCTFNDDIQGTASVVVAGILAAKRIVNKPLKDNLYLMQGAGEANLGIATLLAMAMEKEGLTHEEALERIWMVDSKGLLVKNRPKGGITPEKAPFARDHEPIDIFGDVVKALKPTCLIGAAAMAGSFTEEILKDMASYNDRPLIFALSNPTSKAECTAEEAYHFTEGRAVFASGSPFDPVTYGDKTFYPGQGNNAYIFPGMALGVISCGVRHVRNHYFLFASEALANLVTEAHLAEGRLYPPLTDIRDISVQIAVSIADHAYEQKYAAYYPEPEDKEAFIRSHLYSFAYENFEPITWNLPEAAYLGETI